MRRAIINGIISLLLVFSFPLAVLADDATVAPSTTTSTPTTTTGTSAPTDSTSSTPPATDPGTVDTSNSTSATPVADTGSSQSIAPATTAQQPTSQGPQSPPGPDANTYSFNQQTGLWENQYYIWDPVTRQTKPKTPQTYSYNPSTGKWDTTQWVYDAAAQKYVANTVSVSQPPAGAVLAAVALQSPNNGGASSVYNSVQKTTGIFNLFYDASISNSITSLAATGNAAVQGNTMAGSALSGNAVDISNIINMLQTAYNLQSAANLLTFTTNINGNVTGDITINPNALPQTVVNSQKQTDITINASGSGLINNDINLAATSGTATVSGNTKAGNAQSGNATAIANVVNMLNSAITAGQSFLGVVNINGNLNGDILLPPDFIDQLVASEAPQATMTITNDQTNNVTANLNNTQTINNNVSLAATSGNAQVSGNTTAGNATTGSATTKLTVFNLTGQQLTGKNNLIVFVNVLGKWVGLIMDAPAGTTAAELCGGSCSSTINNNLTLNSDATNTINNNLILTAQTGDATVSGNTSAGNATSGNASASANLLNINNSNLSLSDWFGMLFINVLGTWNGSFGVDTAAGNPPVLAAAQQMSAGGLAPANVFNFVPGGVGGNKSLTFSAKPTSSNHPTGLESSQPAVMASIDQGPSGGAPQAITSHKANYSSEKKSVAWVIPLGVGLIMAVTFVGVDVVPSLSDRISLYRLTHKYGR